jgi:hypothetical protein
MADGRSLAHDGVMHITKTKTTIVAAGVLAAGLALAAGTALASTPGNSGAVTPPGSPPTDARTATFCDTEPQVEALFNNAPEEEGPDPAALQPLNDTLSANAPAEIADAVATLVDVTTSGNVDSPDFEPAYDQIIEYMKSACGFGTVTFTATEYAFGGLPDEIPAGMYVIDMENIGEQFHLGIFFRVNDDVTASMDEILNSDDTESMGTVGGQLFAEPGGVDHAVADLTPGRYIVFCPLPVGITPDVMATGSIPEDAPSHYMEGMKQEVMVS